MKRGTLGLWGERQGLTVVVDNSRPRDEYRRSRPRHRENRDGGCRDQASLAERLRLERREQRDRARYRLYPRRNQSSIMLGRPWAPGHGRREVSRSQRDRENCQEMSTHVQGTVRIEADNMSAPAGDATGRPERVPSPLSVRRVYVRWRTMSGHLRVVQPTQRIWGYITIPRADDRRGLNINLYVRAKPGHHDKFCTDTRVWRKTAVAQADDCWQVSTSDNPCGILCGSPCEDSRISPGSLVSDQPSSTG